MKRMEYTIVTSTFHTDFVEKVNEHLRNGWEIRGETRVLLIDNITMRFMMEFTRERHG